MGEGGGEREGGKEAREEGGKRGGREEGREGGSEEENGGSRRRDTSRTRGFISKPARAPGAAGSGDAL